MPDVDPYNVTYPEVEERMSLDVFPGLMFCFRNDGYGSYVPTAISGDTVTVWTVISTDHTEKGEMYLLLGSTGILTWHRGRLGRIRRLVDPVVEASWRREARELQLTMQLADDALALGA